MTTIRPFEPIDILYFNNINIDPLTETYGIPFYLQYLINWPEYCQVAVHPNGKIMGYILGKAEGKEHNWHGHVTAVSIAPEFRRMKIAAKFMDNLESVSERKGCYFIDLFVRVSNETAIRLYKALGYVIYRRILEYYAADADEQDEDAFDMRKALSKDPERRSEIPLKNPIKPNELEHD